MDISSNIRHHRKRLNLTQKDLATKLCKTESTVRMWELGKNEPTISSLVKMREIFNISIDDLIGRGEVK